MLPLGSPVGRPDSVPSFPESGTEEVAASQNLNSVNTFGARLFRVIPAIVFGWTGQ